ncbi:MAG: hypothetical protein AAFO03_12080 [Bacteroidota bacterium]
MRFSLVLLLLPVLAFGQSPDTPPSDQQVTKRAIKIGLLSQFDAPLDNKYVYTIDGPLLRFRRSARPNLNLDVQVFRNLPHLYLTAGVGFQEIDASIDTMVLDERLTAFHLGYFEDVEMSYWQMTFGFKLELFGQSRFSPYIHPSLLFGIPAEMTYQVDYLHSDTPDGIEFTVVEGGTLASMGYMFQSGIRSQINQRFTVNLGFYYTNLSFDKDWPSIPLRRLGKDFLRLDNGGWELALQYRL